ncbi:glycosyltransferase family 4 protein [Labilibaculum euxinus]|uniref:glycosyltransferase family 4 protein n=1 Tax=Labilibaculum euxinus TaxID=2686357 RepID=UPI0013655C66|nr:glycosyltransferase family 4 protein [Labilibaculum euxinus]MDQ1770348.1 glycosyltransferase family 4 protein [Labilibaculum euxinus]
MKVLMISSLPVNLNSIQGGVDAVVVNLLKGFESFPEVNLLILSLGKSDCRKTVKYAGNITIEYLFRKSQFGGKLFNSFFQMRKDVHNHIREFNPDIVHIQGASPMLFCLLGLNKKNLVITQHGIMAEEINYQKNKTDKLKFWFKMIVERYFYPRFENYIFISSYNRKFLEQLKGNQNYYGKLIFNPVNPIFFDLKTHSKFGKRILYVGVINQRKNLLCLLKAMLRLKNKTGGFKLDVIGGFKDEFYKNLIFSFIKDHNLENEVNFLGWKSQSELLDLYKKADLFVLPSLQESLPVSIAEAMAAGRPVIAADVGGVAEMITANKSGFVFNADNSQELEEFLLKFCNEDGLYSRFSEHAREEAMRKFHPGKVVNQTIEFYKMILES